MQKNMAAYQAELVETLLNDESLNLSNESARNHVSRMSNQTVFELLNIEPDEAAIAQAEIDIAIKQEQKNLQKAQNQHYKRLSKLSGASRIAAIMDMEQNGDIGSILPTSEQELLQSGELKGLDRITAALNHNKA
ncbi:hypothetical protein ACRTDO_09795 [Vibrio furnissii]|uniref:hypothetical protein n=1 Tax=Vibrio furnissii TaxID=29494 RepID=UPI003D7DE2D9